ncbi:MAG: ComF family protein [Planctomycetales bacterium]|nr:ComF family protein [bacterium]UNM07423.1 MAG: ComF family protein [Planctomycetales bacterium]
MKQLLRRFVQLLLPARCSACQRTGPDAICEQCSRELELVIPRYCMKCGRRRSTEYSSPDCAECHGLDIGVARSRSGYIYNELGRTLLADFKFNGNLAVGQELAERVLARIPTRAPRLFDEPGLVLDAILPVPLHPRRRRERRFNQSELLSRMLADHMRLPMRTDLLVRSRETETQVGLTQAQRRSNVSGAFDVSPRWQRRLTGQRFIVVDDLMTTGSTLAACARALRRRGADAVYGLTLFSTNPLVHPADRLAEDDFHNVPPPLI